MPTAFVKYAKKSRAEKYSPSASDVNSGPSSSADRNTSTASAGPMRRALKIKNTLIDGVRNRLAVTRKPESAKNIGRMTRTSEPSGEPRSASAASRPCVIGIECQASTDRASAMRI